MAALLMVDNDVLIKAAHWGLLDFIPASLGTSWDRVATLTSIAFRAKRKDKKLFRDPEVAEALTKRLLNTRELPPPDLETIARLQNTPNLDAGEVLLIGSVIATNGAFLVTGDKRALRALAAKGFAEVVSLLTGRVVCLEHIIGYALQELGALELSRTIEPYRDLDTAVRVIVPAVEYADGAEIRVREALSAYFDDLDRDTYELLARWQPEALSSVPQKT